MTNKLPDKVKKKEQEIARLEQSLAFQKLKKRKAETRTKIEFGGLVVKSKMHEYPKDVILGCLIKSVEMLENDPGYMELCKSIGQNEFLDN